ncbi:UDP-N-acetylglucosamine transferase subunit alg13 [Rhynchospora pubera]|uniref:UDP-N-acetylglucosamine transferase subunit alg13 n=1 Tax=Rhynchospora pubera TaxID=906938 RepID=A0AAV8ETR3_9POAL|nr:UDP-N-acetylglucosamine transferase subunit alg13 [Rhynchospora pubera]
MGKRREVIMTVGTTKFDKLVAGVDSESVKSALVRRGFSHLQIHIQIPLSDLSEQETEVDHLKAASLVITHAGSESIFETLRLSKPLIVVGNEGLMAKDRTTIKLSWNKSSPTESTSSLFVGPTC